LRRVVVRVFEDRQPTQDLARPQHLPPDAADHPFQSDLVRVRMIMLRSGELTQPDRHHLEEPAFDLPGEIGVPFHAPQQHHAVALMRVAVHEGVDAFRRHADRHYIQ
jgi:hypothetical protein